MIGPLTTNQHDNALTTLLSRSERGRAYRASQRPCEAPEWDGVAWTGEIEGTGGRVYFPRIQLVGARTFACTCPDHKKQRGSKGPCKHVISLAEAALEEVDLHMALEDYRAAM
jgi:hypothetical protein